MVLSSRAQKMQDFWCFGRWSASEITRWDLDCPWRGVAHPVNDCSELWILHCLLIAACLPVKCQWVCLQWPCVRVELLDIPGVQPETHMQGNWWIARWGAIDADLEVADHHILELEVSIAICILKIHYAPSMPETMLWLSINLCLKSFLLQSIWTSKSSIETLQAETHEWFNAFMASLKQILSPVLLPRHADRGWGSIVQWMPLLLRQPPSPELGLLSTCNHKRTLSSERDWSAD